MAPNSTVKNRMFSAIEDFFNAGEYCDRILIIKNIMKTIKRHSMIREILSNSLLPPSRCLF